MVGLFLGMMSVSSPAQSLQQYVSRPEPAYSVTRENFLGRDGLRVVSQTWQGIDWSHRIVVVRPRTGGSQTTAILEVTGWEPNDREIRDAQHLADMAGMPVALLYDIPNQPLFDGLTEDDLIAYTGQKYMETGDTSWPLLMPMVKSVRQAMQALSDRGNGFGFQRFVVTGASKRGWTTYLVGALNDSRVIGLAPRVFDFVGFEKQIERQMEYWGRMSPMLGSYDSVSLPELSRSEEGRRLLSLVDPASFAEQIASKPLMVILGANDPYWAINAASLYWYEFDTEQKWVVAVPNAGHGLEDSDFWMPSLAMFARHCAEGRVLPMISFDYTASGDDSFEILVASEPPYVSYRLWRAVSSDLDFTASRFAQMLSKTGPATEGFATVTLEGERNENANQALIVEFEYEYRGTKFRLTTIPFLFKKSGS